MDKNIQLWRLEETEDWFTFKEDMNGLPWEKVKEPIIKFYKDRLEWIEPLTEEEWKQTNNIKE